MKTSNKGLRLIQAFEGCKLKAYRCPAGVLTIGYGHTGDKVFEGMVITESRAEELLAQDLEWAERAVIRACNPLPLTQGQFDALVSLVFNIGETAFVRSTLLRRLRQGFTAAEEFLRWDKVNGKPLAGLARRREAEKALFLS